MVSSSLSVILIRIIIVVVVIVGLSKCVFMYVCALRIVHSRQIRDSKEEEEEEEEEEEACGK